MVHVVCYSNNSPLLPQLGLVTLIKQFIPSYQEAANEYFPLKVDATTISQPLLLSHSSCVHLHLNDLFISRSNVSLPMFFLILPFGVHGGFTLQMNKGGTYRWIWNWEWGVVPGYLRERLSHSFASAMQGSLVQ